MQVHKHVDRTLKVYDLAKRTCENGLSSCGWDIESL